MLYLLFRKGQEERWRECSSAASGVLQLLAGYTVGYFGLATLQATAVLFESLWLFDLNFKKETILILFIVIWLLAVVSVMLGIFVSTFARNEGHVLPFIPLIILPSVFLTGLIIDTDALPGWAAFIGKCLPLHYAVNIIHEIIKPEYSFIIPIWILLSSWDTFSFYGFLPRLH